MQTGTHRNSWCACCASNTWLLSLTHTHTVIHRIDSIMNHWGTRTIHKHIIVWVIYRGIYRWRWDKWCNNETMFINKTTPVRSLIILWRRFTDNTQTRVLQTTWHHYQTWLYLIHPNNTANIRRHQYKYLYKQLDVTTLLQMWRQRDILTRQTRRRQPPGLCKYKDATTRVTSREEQNRGGKRGVSCGHFTH